MCCSKNLHYTAQSMPRVINRCPETPVFGSDYCQEHSSLAGCQDPHIVVTIDCINMRSSTKVVTCTDQLPGNDDVTVHVGCKQANNVDRFSKRTAGLMVLVRPCGVIVDFREMVSCESPSQLFAQLLSLRCDRDVHFKYIGYDRACEFQPFLQNLTKKAIMELKSF